MLRFLRRNVVTAMKLPVAVAWDALTYGNFGDGFSTAKVVRQHKTQADIDAVVDLIEDVKKAVR